MNKNKLRLAKDIPDGTVVKKSSGLTFTLDKKNGVMYRGDREIAILDDELLEIVAS